MTDVWMCESRNSNDTDYDNPTPHPADLLVKLPGGLDFHPICVRHLCCLRAGFEVAGLQVIPPAATSYNLRTSIHLAPDGEIQYVHLEKDGQVISLTIGQATCLFYEIGSRLGLTRP